MAARAAAEMRQETQANCPQKFKSPPAFKPKHAYFIKTGMLRQTSSSIRDIQPGRQEEKEESASIFMQGIQKSVLAAVGKQQGGEILN